MTARVGIGYDSHRFVSGRPLIIGGVEIPHDRGLDGHSDADVLTHAITDALLGAAGGADIGTHFPDTDDEWKGADSIRLLGRVVELIGGRAINADATVICEGPRLAPHREEMEQRLSAALEAPVSVKATTNEGLGALGRGEGIAAMAVVLFEPNGSSSGAGE
jgi:2-C-methyl-D-erythritol 2,4-cyclodiphosphate synthase